MPAKRRGQIHCGSVCVCVCAWLRRIVLPGHHLLLNVRLVRALVASAPSFGAVFPYFIRFSVFYEIVEAATGRGYWWWRRWWWRQLNKMQNINYLMNRLIVNRNCILSHKLLANSEEIPLMEISQRQISNECEWSASARDANTEAENEDGHQKWLSLCFQFSNLFTWPKIRWRICIESIYRPFDSVPSCMLWSFGVADVRCVHFLFVICKVIFDTFSLRNLF